MPNMKGLRKTGAGTLGCAGIVLQETPIIETETFILEKCYSLFQGFSKAKSANGGSILSSSQFLILP